jgi:hypothetical protein
MNENGPPKAEDEQRTSAATTMDDSAGSPLASTGTPPSGTDAPAAPVVVEVPIRVESPNRLHDEHPGSRARRVRGERAAVREALAPLPLPEGPWLVRLFRLAPRRLDDDNATASMKAVRDEVAAWLGVDDRDPRVRFIVEQERAKTYAVRIEVGTMANEVRP